MFNSNINFSWRAFYGRTRRMRIIESNREVWANLSPEEQSQELSAMSEMRKDFDWKKEFLETMDPEYDLRGSL